jgi:hypothetical protein
VSEAVRTRARIAEQDCGRNDGTFPIPAICTAVPRKSDAAIFDTRRNAIECENSAHYVRPTFPIKKCIREPPFAG